MKTNLRLLALLLLLGFAQTTAHAQCPGVWVPDANFRNFLKTTYPQVIGAGDSLLPCQAATVTGTMSFPSGIISDISGIEYFSVLTGLVCRTNRITVLASLPPNLRFLECGQNNMTTILSLPDSLRTLRCSVNQLTSLPALPSKMTELECFYNQLTSLPSLPNGLYTLDCGHNLLTSLPSLPDSLVNFFCNYNQLTSLPSIPNKVRALGCGNNQLTSLPSIPNSLYSLSCGNNLLTSLPTLNNIGLLVCPFNNLTELPTLPTNLYSLGCSNNYISALPALPSTLNYLYCSHNSLSTLPNLPMNLEQFECDSNQIVCLPLLPNNVRRIIASGNIFNCLPNIPTTSNFRSDIWSVCSTPCVFGKKIINGKVFYDSNSDGTFNTLEDVLVSKVISTHNNNFTATDRYGNYVFYLDSGSYTLSITPIKWHTLSVPTTPYTFNFPANDSIVRDVNFGFVPTPNITDVSVSLTAVDRPRPGFSFCYNLSYKNEGTVAASGTVNLSIDPQLNYTGQTAFSFSNLGLFASWDTTVCLTVPVSLPLGTQVFSSAHAVPTLPDADTTNNRAVEASTVVGSYDPNDKACSPESLTPAEVTAGKRLTYTIRFQNTGTAEAYFVAIEDTLDAAHLDISSLEILAASHAYEMSLSGPGHVKFMFHGINLPDSTTDEPNSHGFVKYSIRPKTTLALGDQISNTAHIYFDFNPAIVTNTVLTEVAQPTGLNEILLGSLSLQPNPASSSVTLRADALAGQAVSLTVLDLTGRAVYQATESLFSGQTALDLSGLPTGCYFVQLQAKGGVLSQKLVVVR